jgi:hypothetical protein
VFAVLHYIHWGRELRNIILFSICAFLLCIEYLGFLYLASLKGESSMNGGQRLGKQMSVLPLLSCMTSSINLILPKHYFLFVEWSKSNYFIGLNEIINI